MIHSLTFFEKKENTSEAAFGHFDNIDDYKQNPPFIGVENFTWDTESNLVDVWNTHQYYLPEKSQEYFGFWRVKYKK